MNVLQFPTYKHEQSGADPKAPLLLLSFLLGFTSLSCLLSLFSMSLTPCLSEFWPDISTLSLFSPLVCGGPTTPHELCAVPKLLPGTSLPYWHLFKKRTAQICQLWRHLELVSRAAHFLKNLCYCQPFCPSPHSLFVTIILLKAE